MSDPNAESPQSARPRRGRSIWFHLHFWIGWIAALPIIVVCVTGCLLTWDSAIRRWEHPERYHLTVSGDRMSPGEVLAVLEAAQPPLQVNHLGVPESETEMFGAYVLALQEDGSRAGGKVFVNPYTGEITRTSKEFSWAEWLTSLHRRLAYGKIGQMVVGVSSLVLAITSIFGLVLWWPMRGRTFARAWKRGNALDWHNALGVVVLLPLIIMALTGITFTWGKSIFPPLERLQGRPAQVAPPKVQPPDDRTRAPMDEVIRTVEQSLPGGRIGGIQPSNQPAHPHTFLVAGQNLRIFVNPYTGKEISRSDGSGTGPVGWYRQNFGTLHMLTGYHGFARLLWALCSLFGAVLAFTGLWISIARWRRRRRSG